MISLKRWGIWKPNAKPKAIASAPSTAAASGRTKPRPVVRWIAEGRVALRAFDFENDAEAVCSFQPETYSINFPDFVYTARFADAFRYDLRRATLDPNNALFVLDDARERQNIIGFLWLVICQNNWTQERFGYVNNVYVAPHRRGSDLGAELLRQSDEWFRTRGIRRVRLNVTTSNAAALKLYEKNGYRVQRWEMEKEV